MNRTCTRCTKSLPATEEFFRPGKGYALGLRAWCRVCEAEDRKARRPQANARWSAWAAKNREHVRAYHRELQRRLHGHRPRQPGMTRAEINAARRAEYAVSPEKRAEIAAAARAQKAADPELFRAKDRARYAARTAAERAEREAKLAARLASPTKPCKRCGEVKALEAFPPHPATRDGRNVHCRTCKANGARTWRKRNPDQVRDYGRVYGKNWRKANPEKYRAIVSNRAARVRGAGPGITGEEWRATVEAFAGCCAYCGEPSERLQVDHVDAIAKGGAHDSSNILPACRRCNGSKSDFELHEWWPEQPFFSMDRALDIARFDAQRGQEPCSAM